MTRPVLAITMGDPGGIGPEVIVRALQDLKVIPEFHLLLIGTPAPFDFLARNHLSLSLHPITEIHSEKLRPGEINFLDVTTQAKQLMNSQEGFLGFDHAEVSLRNAAAAYAALNTAAAEAVAGRIQALVTAPVHKAAMRLIDPEFAGHTEFLARMAGAQRFAMMFVAPKLRVTLVTIHVPLHKVSSLITEDRVLEKIELTHEFLKNRMGIEKPRLAVCALNPHGSETGEEEERILVPAIGKACSSGIDARGPFAGDQIFYEAYAGKFDAVISMYHDQGLAPFKLIAFRDGVNVTLGLPFVRTSPDHGTAFDIAYSGKADPDSMKAAILLARELAGNAHTN